MRQSDVQFDVSPSEYSQVATYIPQLARSDPKTWAIAVCTVDGQRRSWGAAQVPFCLQSVSKPFTYAIAMDELGAEEVYLIFF